jgi:glucose/arabinose dehydrogenase
MLRRMTAHSRSMPGALLASILLGSAPALAQPQLELLTDQVSQPMYVTHAGDARLFIVERAGRVRVHENGALLPTPYLDVSGQVSTDGEGGLASIAFHPDYAQNGRMFVFYTQRGVPSGTEIVVARFTVSASDPNRVDPDSRRDLLRLPKIQAFHHGGQLQFGPDGFLYISIGDDSGFVVSCNAQEPAQLFGKLLRLDVDVANDVAPWYQIPPANPFADPLDEVADEIWAFGLRNPFRFSFDRGSGALWIGDVGDSSREEVDVQAASSPGGENYGWRVLEGTLCMLPGDPVGENCPIATPPCGDPAYTAPVFEYENPLDDFTAIIGGVVYRGSESPAFQGRYFFADFTSLSSLWALRERTPPYTAELLLADGLAGPVAIGEDREGELYVADLFADRVYRLRLPTTAVAPDADCVLGTNAASAKLAQAAARDLGACALAGATDRLGGGTVEACILEDRKGNVARRIEKLREVGALLCQEEQPFGFVATALAADAAVGSERELAHAVFGPDLDAALADARAAKETHRCQRKLQGALDTCQKARRAAFLRCQKTGFKDGSIGSLADLAACLEADPKGRVEKACDASGGRLARALSRSCEGVALGAAFPGCGSDVPAEAAACLERAGRCRHCRLFDAADALGANCELSDDGVMNASCGPLE